MGTRKIKITQIKSAIGYKKNAKGTLIALGLKKINQSISKSKKKQNKKTLINNSSNTKYALQISAWPSLEDARKHQLKLIEKGFDAYTQRYYWKIKDELWYRVRVGNFSNKNEALKIKKELESLMEIKVWMDIVSK